MNEEQHIEQLPKGWKWVKLGEVCDKISLNKIKIKQKDYLDEGLYPVVDQGQDLIGGYYNNKSLVIPKEPPYIIFGDHTKVKKYINFNFIAGADGVKVLKSKDGVNSKFLFYSLFTIKIEDKGYARHFQLLEKELFPLPPFPTQLAIVSKIEELFSELDKGIENLRTAQQQLKTYRQAVLKWAFEGKLTEEWRSQQINLISGKELLSKIKAEKEKIAKLNKKKIKPLPEIEEDELDELFEIPKKWKWARNEEYLFEVKDGTHDTPKYFGEGIPFVTQKNIREDGLNFNDIQYILEEDHNKFYLRSNVSKGDILISMIGHNRGMTAIVDTDQVFSIKNVGLFKFLPNLQLNKFSFYYYQSRVGLNIVLRKSKGGAQPFIGLTELRNWPVVVCSLDEQIRIVQEIENRLNVADKMEESISQSLQQAEALRQSILKRAFEGNLI